MNLYQKQGGPVDNYHMYIQPQLQLRGTLQQQDANIQRQGVDASALRHHVPSANYGHTACACHLKPRQVTVL